MVIDWKEAPDWADKVVRIGIAQNIAWACDRKYKYLSGDGPFCFFNDPSDGFMLCQTTLVESRPSPSPSWSGEGLPPVDVECEYQRNDVSYKQAWVAVTPRYIGDSITVLKHSASGSEFTEMTASCVFRPIRTPEQIAADERASALHMAICDVEEKVAKWNTTIDCTAAIKATIDAMISLGYRKP